MSGAGGIAEYEVYNPSSRDIHLNLYDAEKDGIMQGTQISSNKLIQ